MPPRGELSPRAKCAMVRAQKKATQQEDDNQSSMADAYLPDHILQKIFLRMPTKPLVQLKCLSKQWNCQISDPKFMKLRSRRMIFFPGFPFHAIDNTVTGGDVFKLFSPSINPDKYEGITIVGSFNGIILLVLKYGKTMFVDHNLSRYHMILYNPFTGVSKTVPLPLSYGSLGNYVYGFGYGTTANDLRIVRLKENRLNNSKSFEVFSLITWTWSKPLELIGDYCFYNTAYSGTFANGFLYWKVERNTSSLPLILALDIKTMVFSEIEILDGCKSNCLGTYNGRLCMICSQINAEGYELRVINEHGLGDSLCTLAPSFTLLISHVFALGELGILDDGKLLLSISSNQLIIYDMFKDSYKVVNVSTSYGVYGRLQFVEYVESTISPSDICTLSI